MFLLRDTDTQVWTLMTEKENFTPTQKQVEIMKINLSEQTYECVVQSPGAVVRTVPGCLRTICTEVSTNARQNCKISARLFFVAAEQSNVRVLRIFLMRLFFSYVTIMTYITDPQLYVITCVWRNVCCRIKFICNAFTPQSIFRIKNGVPHQ